MAGCMPRFDLLRPASAAAASARGGIELPGIVALACASRSPCPTRSGTVVRWSTAGPVLPDNSCASFLRSGPPPVSPGCCGATPAPGPPAPTGGRSATGGALAAGGKLATGGALATGGKLATGGALAAGGKLATGGALAAGSALAAGGAPGTGTADLSGSGVNLIGASWTGAITEGAGEVMLDPQWGQGAVVGGRSNGIWISPRQVSQAKLRVAGGIVSDIGLLRTLNRLLRSHHDVNRGG